MNAKLTLSLDAKVIEEAKRFSKEKGRSLSKIVEDYLGKITEDKKKKKKDLSSIMELKGILGKVPKDFDYDKAKWEYLQKKYK